MNFVNRYSLTYRKSLVYMLQASEYNLAEYLRWFGRTKDFRTVQKRKQLVMTAKARALLLVLYVEDLALIIALAVLGMSAWSSNYRLRSLLLGLGIILLYPDFQAYTIGIPLWLGQLLIQGPRERKIRALAEAKLAKQDAVKIAVAGSYGKTSMREILATVIAAGRRVGVPPDSYNTPLGISDFISKLSGQEEVLVFELGEYYPGDVADLCQLIKPDIGIMTGINESHLEKFKTIERTVGTIWELSDYLVDKPCYKNGESKLIATRAGSDPRMYTRQGVGAWQVSDVQTSLDGTSFTAKQDGGTTIKAQSKLLGVHQVGPLVAAIAIAHDLGLTKQQIEVGLADTKAFAHRMQPKTDEAGVTVIDDSYNGNPDGAKVAIDFLATLKVPKRIYVTPGFVEMGRRNKEVHTELGRQLAKAKIEKIMLVRNSVTPFIEEGLSEANYTGEKVIYDDALTMLAAIPNVTARGDVVLIQNDWTDNYA